jgi:hypothetical protein
VTVAVPTVTTNPVAVGVALFTGGAGLRPVFLTVAGPPPLPLLAGVRPARSTDHGPDPSGRRWATTEGLEFSVNVERP